MGTACMMTSIENDVRHDAGAASSRHQQSSNAGPPPLCAQTSMTVALHAGRECSSVVPHGCAKRCPPSACQGELRGCTFGFMRSLHSRQNLSSGRLGAAASPPPTGTTTASSMLAPAVAHGALSSSCCRCRQRREVGERWRNGNQVLVCVCCSLDGLDGCVLQKRAEGPEGMCS